MPYFIKVYIVKKKKFQLKVYSSLCQTQSFHIEMEADMQAIPITVIIIFSEIIRTKWP